MNKTDAISFWTPIVPKSPVEKFSKEWVRSQADKLFHFGREVYKLDIKTNELTLDKNEPAPSILDKVIRIVLIALVVFPLVAIVIKAFDRLTHQYTLIKSPIPPDKTPPSSPRRDKPPINDTKLTEKEKKHYAELERLTAEAKLKAEEEERKRAGEDREKKPPAPPSLYGLSEEEQTRIKENAVKEAREKKAQEDQRLKAEKEQQAKLAAEAQLVVEQKKKAQEAQEKQIEIAKCHEIAQRFFPEMLKMYRDENGEWNNTWKKEDYVYSCLDFDNRKAQELEDDGKDAEAAKLRDQAGEKEKKYRADAEQKLQKTLFPAELRIDGTLIKTKQDSIIKKEDCFVDCPENFANIELFYPTTQTMAEKIKKEGIDFETPEQSSLEAGLGTYLCLEKRSAEWQVKNYSGKYDSIVTVKVQINGKLAVVDRKIEQFLDVYLQGMTWQFAHNKSEILKAELIKAGLDEKAAGATLFPYFRNLLTQEFFKSAGYRGVYEHQPVRRGSYVNLFHPKEDIASIT